MSNWFAQHRLDWIEEMLKIYGFINRKHVMRKFGVSCIQANKDFNILKKRSPNIMLYDDKARCYISFSESHKVLISVTPHHLPKDMK